MTAPVLFGAGGLTGWLALKRTGSVQREMVARDPVVKRATQYFRDNIGKVNSAEDLVKDYRLLGVTLSAFGLEADQANKAFIRKVLESDRDEARSLVNRLGDKRYRELAQTLALDEGADTIHAPGFADRILAQFNAREFERRVGDGDPNLRLALNAQRELAAMAKRSSSERTLWYEVIGNPPLRKVFEGALGLGPSYAKLPVERQLQEFMNRAQSVLGTTSFKGFGQPEGSEKLVRTFLARAQIAESTPGQNAYSTALKLLRR